MLVITCTCVYNIEHMSICLHIFGGSLKNFFSRNQKLKKSVDVVVVVVVVVILVFVVVIRDFVAIVAQKSRRSF